MSFLKQLVKSDGKSFKCLYRNEAGVRCILPIYIKNDLNNLTCALHVGESVDFLYSPALGVQLLDLHVATLIAKYIDDPTTFYNFSQVSKSAAKACHSLQLSKRLEYSKCSATNVVMCHNRHYVCVHLGYLRLPRKDFCCKLDGSFGFQEVAVFEDATTTYYVNPDYLCKITGNTKLLEMRNISYNVLALKLKNEISRNGISKGQVHVVPRDTHTRLKCRSSLM